MKKTKQMGGRIVRKQQSKTIRCESYEVKERTDIEESKTCRRMKGIKRETESS